MKRVQEEWVKGSHMPTVEWMEDEVRKAVPDAIEVKVVDLTGGQDHFHVRVVSSTFEGMRPLPRQRILLGHFKPYIPVSYTHLTLPTILRV